MNESSSENRGDRTDDELILGCRDAKQAAREAFDQLYRRHAGPVLGFLRAMHRGDEEAARDALQETFFRFYQALPRFEAGRPLKPWLFRIARNVSLDALKKAQALPAGEVVERAEAEEAGPVERASRKEAGEILRAAVEDLPTDERAVFLLKHDQGLTYAEVADALACSVRTAKYRMKAALERLGREAERKGVVA